MATIAEALSLAQQYHRAGNLQQAEQIYRQVLQADPSDADAWNFLGSLAHQTGRQDLAVDCFGRAVALQPRCASYHSNLGYAYQLRGDLQEAVASCQEALRLRPEYASAHNNLGVALEALGEPHQAVVCYREALRFKPDYAEAHNNLGNTLKDQGQLEEAIACYREALRLKPNFPEAQRNCGNALKEQGKPDEAAACYREALRLQPRAELASALHITLATLLPSVYQSTADVYAWRRRLAGEVQQLHQEGICLDLTAQMAEPLFYLAYQGENDRDLLGSVARLYKAPAPAAGPTSWASPPTGAKIRVGFLSSFFKDHTVGRLTRGLIAHLSRACFEVIVLSAGSHHDSIADFIRQHADHYQVVPRHLPAARRLVADQQLDVLFYPDIGMEPFTYTLAFSRLAPVQCVTWGHPSTTAIETIDYFISSDLFETKDAEQHYTESLVRLKSLSVYYYRPCPALPLRRREHFGLRDADHVYACPQSLFKLLPGFDESLAAILRADPLGVLVLVRGKHPHWEERFMQRWAAIMPDVIERVRWVPRQGYQGFLNLNAVSDVLLDPFPFGGGNTSLEGLALGVPVVTLPTPFLRGRLTLGMYKKMSILDCVASGPREYADIAVRLGTEPDHRAAISSRILAANGVLYEDMESIRELERFFQQAVAADRGKQA